MHEKWTTLYNIIRCVYMGRNYENVEEMQDDSDDDIDME